MSEPSSAVFVGGISAGTVNSHLNRARGARKKDHADRSLAALLACACRRVRLDIRAQLGRLRRECSGVCPGPASECRYQFAPANAQDHDCSWFTGCPGQTVGGVPAVATLGRLFDSAHAGDVARAQLGGLLVGLVGYTKAWDPWHAATPGEAAQVLWNLASWEK